MSLLDNGYRRRFIIPNTLVTGGELLIVLSDIAYWNIHYNDLQVWCSQHNSIREGMTVVVPDKPTLTAFCLRWS
jgi:hypothetical protein